MGLSMRELVCTDCAEIVEVFEEPYEFVDPDRYRCGDCMQDRKQPEQRTLELVPKPKRSERKAYDPAQSAIPF
jgi:hypothetical protein